MLHNICLQFDWSIKEQQNQDKIVRNQESGQNCPKPKKKESGQNCPKPKKKESGQNCPKPKKKESGQNCPGTQKKRKMDKIVQQ
jgi:hypothetical protein